MTKYFEIPVFKWTLTLSCRGHNSAAIKKAFSRICKGFDGIVGHQPLQWLLVHHPIHCNQVASRCVSSHIMYVTYNAYFTYNTLRNQITFWFNK